MKLHREKMMPDTAWLYLLAGCVLILVVLSVCPTGIAFAANADASSKPRPLIVGVPDNFPPWVIRDANGNTTGLLKDLWTLWGERNGTEVQFKPMPLARALEEVRSGGIDVIDPIVSTEARRTFLDFSDTFLQADILLYFDQAISGLVDASTAKGFVIGVAAGDACGEKLAAQGIETIQTYPSHEALVNAAVNRQVHVFCAQQPVASYFLTRLDKADDFRHSPPLYAGEGRWAVRKGETELWQRVSAGFQRISPEERDALLMKWYGAKVENAALPLYLRYAGYIGLALAAVLVALAGWNGTLHRQVEAKTAKLASALSDLEEAQLVVERKNAALQEMFRQTISALTTAMAHRDLTTAGHEQQVCDLAVAIGRELGFDEFRLEGLSVAAMVHDVGQMQIPAEILTRPRRLSPEELDLVKMHVESSYQILEKIPFPWPVAEIVYQHHENMDGSGYPRGLSGDQILLEARIIRVADSMEAMLSHRPFRRALPIEKALAQLEAGKGMHYDPAVVDVCTRIIRARHLAAKAA